ncbi:MAG: deoxyhypusine synthase [Candidatus Heimdallarchaeota archaeon]|nr:deoxyhypusine synthase [Candidatus Heimdallarchaeota archaeon]MCK4955553.1 deoxyhypusine synthase [Candidatus Heimdallarchaeota archaeon]
MKKKNSKYPSVNPIDIDEDISIKELIEGFKQSGVFGPGRIAQAVDIYVKMLENDSKIFLGIAGALVPGGMRNILTEMIRRDMVQVIVSTGANVTHDIIEAAGGRHLRQVPYSTDKELRDKSIDRIYDAFVGDDSFMKLEDMLQPLYREIWDENNDKDTNTLTITTYELMKLIGRKIDDKNSFVRAAYEKKVPIFVPAIGDSILGLQLWLFSQMNRTLIDDMGDLGKIQQIAGDSEKAGAIFLGGGVPKNYIFQSRLMSPKTFDYAIQITMDRVETGGLSGAALEEAISWGKVDSESKMVTVVSDITIALPLIFGGTIARMTK